MIAEYDSKDFALGGHLLAFKTSAYTGGTAKDEIFHGWIVFPVPVEIKKLAEKA